MSNTVLKVENLSKMYRLGLVGTGTISHDLNRWWHLARGKEDPYLKVGQTNDRAEVGGEYVWALKDINFEVQQGEILGIIGKNGAGKSTLLKILSKVTSPTEGKIKVKGRIASLLEVGTGFHPELTGRENIYLNGTILGMTQREVKTKLDEIVDFAGVAKYLDTPVKRYSSGMTVRLGFAVAAHLEPEILIVDEVLAVGDAEFQKKAIGKMKNVAGEGRTVLFVSHNMSIISDFCPKSILFDMGTVIKMGTTSQVLSTYLNKESSTLHSLKNINSKFRKGSKEITFYDVSLLSPENKITKIIKTGQNISISFKLKNNRLIKSDIKIGFSIHNSLGSTIAIFYSNYFGFFYKVNEVDSYVHGVCENIMLPLTPDSYTIKGLIQSKDSTVIYDWPQFSLVDFQIIFSGIRETKDVNVNVPLFINCNWTK